MFYFVNCCFGCNEEQKKVCFLSDGKSYLLHSCSENLFIFEKDNKSVAFTSCDLAKKIVLSIGYKFFSNAIISIPTEKKDDLDLWKELEKTLAASKIQIKEYKLNNTLEEYQLTNDLELIGGKNKC